MQSYLLETADRLNQHYQRIKYYSQLSRRRTTKQIRLCFSSAKAPGPQPKRFGDPTLVLLASTFRDLTNSSSFIRRSNRYPFTLTDLHLN